MLRKEKQGVVWFEFALLQAYPHLQHAVFAQNNLDLGVAENREKAFRAIGKPEEISAVYLQQVHEDYVHTIVEKPKQAHSIEACDAVISLQKETALTIQHADCQAALFYDPKQCCIAAVHSGWRGSVKNIYKKTIDTMQKKAGSDPKDLIVCISPSLGPDAAEFINYKMELPEQFWQFQHKPLYFDFWAISKWQLEQAGVLPKNIEIASLCTYSDPSQFYSYRRNRTKERHLTTLWLL